MSEKISIASWNINSVRFGMDIVQQFLREAAQDDRGFENRAEGLSLHSSDRNGVGTNAGTTTT
jgi:hypothetical protein